MKWNGGKKLTCSRFDLRTSFPRCSSSVSRAPPALLRGITHILWTISPVTSSLTMRGFSRSLFFPR